MLYQITSYFKYILHSRNKHGVHSPFVYNFVTGCLNNSGFYKEYSLLDKQRKSLYNSDLQIEMTDFGEGSRVFKTNLRSVSQLARKTGISKKRQRLLFRTARYFECNHILELGTSLGMATSALALACPAARIHTVEGCENTQKTAEENFQKLNLKNITSHQSRFSDFLMHHPDGKYDLIYLDGDHNGKRSLEYFEFLLPKTHNDTVLILDDIYWSREMTAAWEKIKSHPQVTVSIDTFQWGIIFFRKEQAKQHFTIRT